MRLRTRPSHASASVLASADRVWLVNAVTGVLLFVSVVVFVAMHRPDPSFASAPADAAAQQPVDYALPSTVPFGESAPAFPSSGLSPTPGTARPSSAGAAGPASALAADGIPQTALLAYQQAAQWEDAADPACGITWPLLAAIGRVESDHGRFAGAILHTDGTSTPPVIGIPLDGNGTALIRDTDRGRLDGDTVYDRAVGPMQFIPSTWGSYGVDADHNGTADPFNIFDAAATAARYLCAASSLTTQAGQVRAVLTYNHSDAYVAEVLELERTYAAGGGVVVPVTAGPVATTGQRPPALPPANPGPPLGSGSPSTPPSSTSSGPSRTSASPPPSTTDPGDPSDPGSPGDSDTATPTDGTGPSTTPGPVVTPTDPPSDSQSSDPGSASPADPSDLPSPATS